MGTKRVGLARTQALMENLKRDIKLAGTTFSGGKREVLRASDFTSNAYTLKTTDSGCVVLLDQDAADAITMPAVTSADLGVSYVIVQTVAGNTAKTITTGYDNDYWVGGVANLPTAAEAGAKTHVPAGATDTIITFDDNLTNGAGNIGSWVRLTAILTGNTAGGGGAKLVWLVEGVMGTADPNGNGTAIFT